VDLNIPYLRSPVIAQTREALLKGKDQYG
jgi:hypothetical protein